MNNNADNKPGVMIYFDIIPLIEGMSPDDAGQLFLAILKYAQYGEIPSLSGFGLSGRLLNRWLTVTANGTILSGRKNNGRFIAEKQSAGVKLRLSWKRGSSKVNAHQR